MMLCTANDIKDEGAAMMGELLKTNETLTMLYLGGNETRMNKWMDVLNIKNISNQETILKMKDQE